MGVAVGILTPTMLKADGHTWKILNITLLASPNLSDQFRTVQSIWYGSAATFSAWQWIYGNYSSRSRRVSWLLRCSLNVACTLFFRSGEQFLCRGCYHKWQRFSSPWVYAPKDNRERSAILRRFEPLLTTSRRLYFRAWLENRPRSPYRSHGDSIWYKQTEYKVISGRYRQVESHR